MKEKECSFGKAMECLVKVYIEAEYYAQNKDISKLDTKQLKIKVKTFLETSIEKAIEMAKKEIDLKYKSKF